MTVVMIFFFFFFFKSRGSVGCCIDKTAIFGRGFRFFVVVVVVDLMTSQMIRKLALPNLHNVVQFLLQSTREEKKGLKLFSR